MNKIAKKSGSSDRRVQKTRKLLSDALVSLILEKGYEAVSIQDILDRANVGRSTFYAHYENKEQLLLFGHEHLRHLMMSGSQGALDFLSFYRHLVEKHQLVHRLLTEERSEEVLTRSLRDILQYSVLRLYSGADTEPLEKKESLPMLHLRADAASAALVQLMTSWIKKGMPFPPETMAAESTSLMQRIVRG